DQRSLQRSCCCIGTESAATHDSANWALRGTARTIRAFAIWNRLCADDHGCWCRPGGIRWIKGALFDNSSENESDTETWWRKRGVGGRVRVARLRPAWRRTIFGVSPAPEPGHALPIVCIRRQVLIFSAYY